MFEFIAPVIGLALGCPKRDTLLLHLSNQIWIQRALGCCVCVCKCYSIKCEIIWTIAFHSWTFYLPLISWEAPFVTPRDLMWFSTPTKNAATLTCVRIPTSCWIKRVRFLWLNKMFLSPSFTLSRELFPLEWYYTRLWRFPYFSTSLVYWRKMPISVYQETNCICAHMNLKVFSHK